MSTSAGVAADRVLVTIADHIATLTLNRPAKLNAIDPLLLDRLELELRGLDANDEVRVVLVTGAGDRAFCGGADIGSWAALDPLTMWRRWIKDGHRVLDALAGLRQPTIAVINGYCFGGGLEVALACDLRLAHAGVALAAPETKLGTVPGWGGTQRLPALVGASRAKQMIFTGARIPADLAEGWGLVNEVVPAERLMARALELAGQIAANAPVAVQLAKQAIDGGRGVGLGSNLEAIAGAMASATADGQEGLAAYREKRAAHFAGC